MSNASFSSFSMYVQHTVGAFPEVKIVLVLACFRANVGMLVQSLIGAEVVSNAFRGKALGFSNVYCIARRVHAEASVTNVLVVTTKWWKVIFLAGVEKVLSSANHATLNNRG